MSKKQQRWASDDDANDLLAGILDETEDDAKAEEERIQAQIQARDAEERRLRDAENERKRREAEARISAETERQGHVQERRTARMEALKIEDLKARGEWIDPAILAKEQAEAAAKFREEEDAKIRRDAIAAAAVQSAAAVGGPIPANTNTSNTKLYASLGVVAALVLVGGGVLFAMSQGYEVDQTAYSKTVFKPKDVAVALVEKGFTPLPKAEVVVEEEPAAKTSRRSSRSSRSSKTSSKPAAKTAKTDGVGLKAKEKANALGDLLKNSSDPFGGM